MIKETVIVATRLPIVDARLLRKVCEARGENVSNFLRRSLKKELARLSYYPSEVKKALGIIDDLNRSSMKMEKVEVPAK